MKIIKGKVFKDGDPALFIDGESDILITECDFSGTPRDKDGNVVEAWVMAKSYANLIIRGDYFHDIIGGAVCLRSTGLGSMGTIIEHNLVENVTVLRHCPQACCRRECTTSAIHLTHARNGTG